MKPSFSLILLLCIFQIIATTSFFSKKSFFLASNPKDIHINVTSTLSQGTSNVLSLQIGNSDITNDPFLSWKSSNTSVAIIQNNTILSVNPGNVTIYAEYNNNIISTFDITVTRYVSPPEDEDIVKQANEILDKMNISAKIGQMFVIGFDGVTMDDSFIQAIEQCNFGNVIYMGRNVEDYTILSKLTNNIQEKLIGTNGVPGFISTDQEGGNVARLVKGATHFIGAMAMSATGNTSNTFELGNAMGKELYNYGIRTDYTPVLDVNNNPNNPIIGIRSYSDNPVQVSQYGNNMTKGLRSSNVMACAKHFPGHGNTNVDSHIGLPVINSTKEELYKTELAPFISAISDGIDAIMTTHIIFSAFDNEYPATLSHTVLTKLLRESIGFTGLVFTDGMEMAGVAKNYGGHDVISVLAINAGVDILLYTSNKNPRIAHAALVNAVANGTISESRINDSVRRILIKKIKYGLIDKYKADDADISEMLLKHEEMNINFAKESLTLLKGQFNGLDKTKSTLIISPTKDTVVIDESLTTQSFAEYGSKYLKSKGMETVDYMIVSSNMTDEEITEATNKVKNYDQIVLAFNNVKTKEYETTYTFVNSVADMEKELIVVALETPYDLMVYNKEKIKTYICTYNYMRATVMALSMFLNGEFEAKGVFPLSKEGFE